MTSCLILRKYEVASADIVILSGELAAFEATESFLLIGKNKGNLKTLDHGLMHTMPRA